MGWSLAALKTVLALPLKTLARYDHAVRIQTCVPYQCPERMEVSCQATRSCATSLNLCTFLCLQDMVCSDYSGMPLLGMWPEIDDQLSRSTGNQENRAVQVANQRAFTFCVLNTETLWLKGRSISAHFEAQKVGVHRRMWPETQ